MSKNIEKERERKIAAEAIKQKESMEKDHSAFFLRPEFPKYVRDSLLAVGNRNGNNVNLSVKILNNSDPSVPVAYTNGKTVTLNVGSKFFEGLELAEHIEVVLGIAAHELSHILYTGFTEFERAMKDMKDGTIRHLPRSKDKIVLDNLPKMKAALKDKIGKQVIMSIYSDTHNILEDGYIEDNFLNEYNGELADALCFTREFQFYSGDSIPVVREKTADSPKWAMFHNLFLQYAKYGRFLCDTLSELNCEEIEYMEKLFPVFDKYMSIPHGHHAQKLSLVTELMCRSWDIVEDYIEQAKMEEKFLEALKEMLKNAGCDGISSKMPDGADPFSPGNDDDSDDDDEGTEGEGSGKPSNKGSGSGRSAASKKTKESIEDAKSGKDGKGTKDDKKDKNGKDSKEGKDGKDDKGGNGGKGDKDGKNGKDPSGGKDKKGGTDDGDDGDEVPERVTPVASEEKTMGDGSSGPNHKVVCNVIDEEGGRIDNSADGGIEGDGEGLVIRETISDSGYEKTAADIETLINTVARESAKSSLEAASASAIARAASRTKLTGNHSDVNLYIERIGVVPERLKEEYDRIAEPLLKISKLLQKAVAKRLKEVRMGSKQTNLLVGKKLMTNALYRVDGRVFSSTRLPQPNKLAVALLIDESGSMSCDHRVTSARASAIIIEDFCRGLGIPCCIYGHSADQHRGTSVELYSYVSFDNIDGNDKYRLMDISARNGNRDGAALMFVGNEMIKRPEENRIIILISDGQPAAAGYYGQEAEDDLRTIKKQLNRAGIPLFSAAIGADKENIHRIYGDGFMDISDLNDMPKILANLITKFCKI